MTKPARVAFIGLGKMGKPMAANLVRAGFAVTVVPHRRREPGDELQALGATLASTPKEAAAGAAFAITMLPDSPQVEAVTLGPDGILEGASPGLLLIDMSTIAPRAVHRIAERLESRGCRMLDAPVSGGPARAQNGTLTIMVGGEAADVQRARPVLEALGSRIAHVGPLGSGQVAKICNNLLGAIIMAANCEALALAVKCGLKADALRELILASSGSNWLLEHHVPHNVLRDRYEPGFALRLMSKDLRLAEELATQAGLPIFLGTLARQLYRMAEGLGYSEQDFSCVAQLYQQAANVTIATGSPRNQAPFAGETGGGSSS